MQKKSFQIECQFFHDRFWPASAVKIRGKWMRIDIRQAECLCNILAGIPCAFDAHLIRRGVAAAMPSPQGGGIARGRCRISSEAGLAPSGFPAAQIFQNRRSFAPQGGKAKGAQRHESPPDLGGLCDAYIRLYSGVRRAQVLCTRAHKPAPVRGTARSVSPTGRTAQRPAVRSRTCAAKASPASSGSRAQTVTAAAYCVSCTTPPSAATAARTGS